VRGRTVARGAATATSTRRLLRIRLRRVGAGRRLLAAGRRARVRLTVSFRPAGAASAIAVSRAATLRGG
jgi:hypothetical protein